MRTLHSSSALAAKFSDFWTNRDKDPLLTAIGIDGETPEPLRFERRFPTGLKGTPPHLDVTLEPTGASSGANKLPPSERRLNNPPTAGRHQTSRRLADTHA